MILISPCEHHPFDLDVPCQKQNLWWEAPSPGGADASCVHPAQGSCEQTGQLLLRNHPEAREKSLTGGVGVAFLKR